VTDPACFSSRPFVRLQSWRRLAVFVPILVAKETVGQLETVSEGFPNCTGKVFAGARLRQRLRRGNLSVRCLTADECDGDVTHRRIGLRAMPMAFTRLDVNDITDINFAPFMLGGNRAGTGGYDQHLVAVMGMPSRGAALAEVHDAAVIVGRVSRVNDRLARPGNRACVPFRSAPHLPLGHSAHL